MAADTVMSSLTFIQKDELYNDEKPFIVSYDLDGDLPRSNLKLETHENIQIEDIRGREQSFTVNKNGFTIMKLDTGMEPEDFDNEESVKTRYYPQLASQLKEILGAARVQVFEHVIRRRHKTYPISTGERYEEQQPASIVHIDTSPEWSTIMAEKLNNNDDFLKKRHQTMNVWKPLRGPVRDWPLALCDISSVDLADVHSGDSVYPNVVVESCQVNYNPEQKWHYLSNQKATEALVFIQADSKDAWVKSGVPHSAFAHPMTTEDDMPRESIEVRTIVWYNEKI